MTTPRAPVLDLFLSRDAGAWRLYIAPSSWCPPLLANRVDAQREIHPVREPDLGELERHMWASDAPYEKRLASYGVQLVARGCSAIALLIWLEDVVPADR